MSICATLISDALFANDAKERDVQVITSSRPDIDIPEMRHVFREAKRDTHAKLTQRDHMRPVEHLENDKFRPTA